MNRFFFLLVVSAICLASCQSKKKSTNKFTDPVIVKICDLKDKRLSDSLIIFFSEQNAVYRKESVLAFGSVQDSLAVEKIGYLLKTDPDADVRFAAAFSLGQIRSAASSRILEQAFTTEKDPKVTNQILEAFGKVSKQWHPLTAEADTVKDSGLAWSLYGAGLRNSVKSSENKIAAALLSKNHKENARLGAANFFSRAAKDMENYSSVIIHSALNDPAPEVRMASALALRKIKTDSSLSVLKKILQEDTDYRVRVNAARSMASFPLEETKEYLFNALNDKNVNVGIAASEVIKAMVTEPIWIDVANRVTDLKNWRMQANLYEAILKVKETPSIIDEVKKEYYQSANPYQKSALIAALQQSLGSRDIIEEELFKTDIPVIKTAAASALVALNRNKNFSQSLKKHFADLYVRAIQTGDQAVVGTVAEALGDSTLGYTAIIKDFSFLTEARKKLSLPKDIEALRPLEIAIAHFEKRKPTPSIKNNFNHPIDWELVKTISKDQLATIKTTKGNITIRLLVEEAPGSVANFVKLAQDNYFDQKYFHRVVPNFVVQAGCNRGDGYGSEDFSLRSEFSPRKYKTGSVGMASAGKDTEGTQWFITHSPTPHLDGGYTIFAEVEKGMDVVDHIEVGDRILDVEISIEPDNK